ncbi:uncharacterized protein LOC122963992 [Acropora millepora]|uniref:uncharacterized protein LOC122963992 n=1 Tax=Acropora millepora TaxID=45264 RepID=UPI001CF2BB5D|nr:uncharacterized protein LOC122963992 [Acropora millepora]
MQLFDEYEKFVQRCDIEHKQLILIGDINSDYAKTPLDVHTRTLQFISSVYQLEQLIKEPTRVTKSSATTIDLIFTNMVDKIATTGVIHLGISDHSLIYAVRKFAVPKTRPTIKEVRNFKHFVEVDFINDLKRVSWQNVECFDDPNLAWQAWKSDFNAILDHHAPIRHMRVRQSSVPWLTFDIKRVMRERDYHKKHAVKYGSHNHWVLYQSARNKSGFRPLHSTVSALIQMCDDWSDNMDKGRLTGVVFLDIRKAFDSVDYSILLEKVQFYGVADRELMWFKSYLTARQQQCLVNGCLSSQSNLLCGVPQGSTLGHLLFLIYINDLPNCLKFTTPCLYADDIQIFTSSFDRGVLANNINSDLKNLSDWLIVNKLQFHPLKTKLMVVGSTYNLNTKSGELSNVISIDNNLVSRVPSNKCLGVLLDEKLTFETHIDYICKKACAGIGALRRIKPFVPLCTLVTLYRSLIEPYFDYCSPLWDTCGKQLKDKLQKIQNRAGRVITGSSYDVRSIDVLDNLKWKTLETRRFHAKATLMYKILNDLSAPQLSNSFVKPNATYINYNLRNIETDLALPRPYTNFLKRSFRYSGAMLWNNLSYEAKTPQSLADFKHKLASSPSMPST